MSHGMFAKFIWDKLGRLWSSFSTHVFAAGWKHPQRKRGREGERAIEEGRREENKNEEQLIVHKSSRSIVSGLPPTALGDVVPMKRSKIPSANFHCPSSHTGWDAASMQALAHLESFNTSQHYNHERISKQTPPAWKWATLAPTGANSQWNRRIMMFWLNVGLQK